MSAASFVVLLFLPAIASCDNEDVSLDYGSLLQHHHQPRYLDGSYISKLNHVFVLSQEGPSEQRGYVRIRALIRLMCRHALPSCDICLRLLIPKLNPNSHARLFAVDPLAQGERC